MNVCKVSNVSQLVKPLTVSKPVLSNNVRNVLKVNSISQLVKTFNVTKTVCSSNANNSAISSSTCKSVSNFVSDCQPVKPAHECIDVNQKRPREQLVNNKNSRQHDFTFSTVDILLMFIYFYEFFYFLYFIITFAMTMLTFFSKAMSGVITFLQESF